MRFDHPEVLVLGAGGILGEAWMGGLLAGLHEASGWDPRDCEHFVGTSAGSIVAAGLAGRRAVGGAPRGPPRPASPPRPPPGPAARRARARGERRVDRRSVALHA